MRRMLSTDDGGHPVSNAAGHSRRYRITIGSFSLYVRYREDTPCISALEEDDGNAVFREECGTWHHIRSGYSSLVVPCTRNCLSCNNHHIRSRCVTEERGLLRSHNHGGGCKAKSVSGRSRSKEMKEHDDNTTSWISGVGGSASTDRMGSLLSGTSEVQRRYSWRDIHFKERKETERQTKTAELPGSKPVSLENIAIPIYSECFLRFLRTATITDSGYISCVHGQPATGVLPMETDSNPSEGHRNNLENHIQDPTLMSFDSSTVSPTEMETTNDNQALDNGSTCSETPSSLPNSIRGRYVIALAEMIFEVISLYPASKDILEKIYRALPILLKRLSLSISDDANSQAYQDAVFIIRKYRR